MLKKSFSFWQNVVLTDETRVRISIDGIVRAFRKKNEISWKKHKKFEFSKTKNKKNKFF